MTERFGRFLRTMISAFIQLGLLTTTGAWLGSNSPFQPKQSK